MELILNSRAQTLTCCWTSRIEPRQSSHRPVKKRTRVPGFWLGIAFSHGLQLSARTKCTSIGPTKIICRHPCWQIYPSTHIFAFAETMPAPWMTCRRKVLANTCLSKLTQYMFRHLLSSSFAQLGKKEKSRRIAKQSLSWNAFDTALYKHEYVKDRPQSHHGKKVFIFSRKNDTITHAGNQLGLFLS